MTTKNNTISPNKNPSINQQIETDTISTTGSPQQELTFDPPTVWELLVNERRRMIILILANIGRDYEGVGPYVPLGKIADILVKASRNQPSRKSMYVTIYQTHVDKLEEAGVVAYNDQETKIRPELRLYKLESIVLEMERLINEV